MAIDYELIGKRMKKARIKKGYTQEDMSDMIMTSVAFYSRLETGRTHINLKRILQIADILDVEPSYFITGINQKEKTYLDHEFYDILSNCTPEQQKFIYKMAELVKNEL